MKLRSSWYFNIVVLTWDLIFGIFPEAAEAYLRPCQTFMTQYHWYLDVWQSFKRTNWICLFKYLCKIFRKKSNCFYLLGSFLSWTYWMFKYQCLNTHALRQIISLSHFIILQCSAFTHSCNYIDANKICSVVNKLFCKTHFVFFTVTNLLLVLSNSVKWLCDLASLYWIQMHLLLRY